MSSGTWTTTKGGGLGITISTGGVVALIAAGYALTHPKQAEAAASGAATIAAITVGVIVVAVVAVVVLKLRGRSRTSVTGCDANALRPGLQWVDNPRAIPVKAREVPAIAPAPVININIGPDLTAWLGEQVAARRAAQPPAPVYVQSETVQQQEIPR